MLEVITFIFTTRKCKPLNKYQKVILSHFFFSTVHVLSLSTPYMVVFKEMKCVYTNNKENRQYIINKNSNKNIEKKKISIDRIVNNVHMYYLPLKV